MKIAATELQMASSHFLQQQSEEKESLKLWIGNRRPDFEGKGNTASLAGLPSSPSIPATTPTVQLSDQGLAAQALDSQSTATDAATLDPRLSLLKTVIEYLTGEKVHLFDPSQLQGDGAAMEAPQAPDSSNGGNGNNRATPAGYGVEYDYQRSYTETETTTFSAQGVVKTSDGQEISFNLNLEMSRYYHEESSVRIRAGDAVKKDPLIVNFAGTAAQLTDQRFAFDLDADGKNDQIHLATGGSGFLAFDRNGDGKINDGSELFGPQSGNGFAELASFDEDHNGWIDSGDSIYDKLRLWVKNPNGNDQLSTLAERGIGALSLSRMDTPFDIKDKQNQLQASVLASSVVLQQNGGVGTVQQLDLTA